MTPKTDVPRLTGQLRAAPEPRLAEWLTGPIRANRSLYLQVALAAVLVNLFGLATSLFSMTVYNRIVPNNAID